MPENTVPSGPAANLRPGTAMGRRCADLKALYADLEEKQVRFFDSNRENGVPVSCPPGCGRCCTTFIPDVLPVEAEYLAIHLVVRRPDLVERLRTGGPAGPAGPRACPFWDAGRPGENCTVYAARPLICRLFGFSSSRDKDGGPEFALCRHMEALPGIDGRLLRGSSIPRVLGAEPPMMADHSAKLAALEPQDAGDRKLLTEALPAALSRVAMTLRFAAAEAAERRRLDPGSFGAEDSLRAEFLLRYGTVSAWTGAGMPEPESDPDAPAPSPAPRAA